MKLTCLEREKCGSIIHMASGAAALVGSGMAQIPLSDAVLIAPIQVKMITALGAEFGIKLTESAAKGLFAALSASCVGRAASQLMMGWVPIWGNIVNASTAVGLTQAVGWLAVEHFQEERAKKSLSEKIRRCFASDSEIDEIISEGKEELKGFWGKTKKYCEERFEDLGKRLRTDQ